ncbi:Rha family transcriptional regulator [Mycetocola saprophilus]|uniref:Rha family transcriptional regulator n=1 Tax=Mycetocola saprophilus TaxID=76636 RepID=UPI003BF0A58B
MSAVAPNGAQVTASVLETVNGEPRVSSLKVSERTEVEHRAVLQLVRSKQNELEVFGDLAFEMRDRPGVPGPALQVALLNEPQSTLLMTFMRNSDAVVGFKVDLVKQFYAMKQALIQPALTPEQIVAQALQITTARVAELTQKVELDAPKVEYMDTFVSPDDLFLIRAVGNEIDENENTIRDLLIDKGWIYRKHIGRRFSMSKGRTEDVTEYWPSSEHKAKFRLVPQHNAPRHHNNQVRQTLYVTWDGKVAIARLFGKEAAA